MDPCSGHETVRNDVNAAAMFCSIPSLPNNQQAYCKSATRRSNDRFFLQRRLTGLATVRRPSHLTSKEAEAHWLLNTNKNNSNKSNA